MRLGRRQATVLLILWASAPVGVPGALLARVADAGQDLTRGRRALGVLAERGLITALGGEPPRGQWDRVNILLSPTGVAVLHAWAGRTGGPAREVVQ